jgi:signal transduction histidine kinase
MSTASLLLHDDEPTLALVRGLLLSAGFESVAESSVYKVILSDAGPSPRLVVLGMTAVDERDMEIVPALRQRWPDAWILVLYPASLRERAARALSTGADASLPEPFYPGEFLALARRIAAAPRPNGHAARDGPGARARSGGVESLAAGVAHSIRNPLQILELQLGTAEAEGSMDLRGMREQLRRIGNVVDGLARFSGRRDVSLRPVDVGELVAHVFIDLGKDALGKDGAGRFVVRTGDAPTTVLASHDLLRAGLECLRDRAVRVTPPGAPVEVRVEPRPDAGRRVVEVAVTDGGPPLTDEQRDRLFDPYPDSAGVQDGTGLELAALAGIVRDHGGAVEASAAPSGGTTIRIRLPAADPETAAGKAARA